MIPMLNFIKGPSISLTNNFNHETYPSDLPVLFMVRNFYPSNLPVLFMVKQDFKKIQDQEGVEKRLEKPAP